MNSGHYRCDHRSAIVLVWKTGEIPSKVHVREGTVRAAMAEVNFQIYIRDRQLCSQPQQVKAVVILGWHPHIHHLDIVHKALIVFQYPVQSIVELHLDSMCLRS